MSWNDQNVVTNYSDSVDDTNKGWYEDAVNIPSILALLPTGGGDVLDFGCGPGNLTAILAKQFNATGADSSPLMVEKARQKYPDLNFLVWDGMERFPVAGRSFDAVVTKLTLEFVEDIPRVARQLFDTLKPGGWLVVSVQHPLLAIAMHPEDIIPYWGTPSFDVEIGTTGNTVRKIHRNLHDYTAPFIARGFSLAEITEPQISADIAEQHAARPIDLKFPKRLNMQFRKPFAD